MNRTFLWYIITLFIFSPFISMSQVNAVQFGRSRIQYKKFHWKFYQSNNFDTYFSQGGLELGKYVAQLAEEELPPLESFIEYTIQNRINIVVYNSYDEFKQTNIGLGTDWQNTGGVTQLVNNKMIVYFDGNHAHLRQQIREGIANVLTSNVLFGDNLGEIASNQALLDIPKWLTDGYVAYAAENWNTKKDEDLRNTILAGDYKNFYQFAFDKPLLAGNAFWFYIEEKYKRENVSYFLYLTRLYKSLNKASMKIAKKKFKAILADFMEYEDEKYNLDIRQRKNAPKGSLTVSEDNTKGDYYKFQANPNPKNNSYAVVEFRKGIFQIKLVEDFFDVKVLWKRGYKYYLADKNPNYPILAWDGKGTHLLVIYWESGKIKYFVYDVVADSKTNTKTFDDLDQVLDASFMLDANTVLLSAVKKGHSDIYIYRLEEQKLEQITNDVFDDLNPTFVSFPNRSGIIFSSNRPSGDAVDSDTFLPGKKHFNIFITDIINNSSVKQISQLTNVKHGNANFPMQYNDNHFTYVSDENGIANRWAGFFTTQRNGLDTLYYVGEEILHNPLPKELDSTLSVWKKLEPDSISYFQIFKDSTYSFPLTNYQNSLLETRIAGNNGQVSETRLDGDDKLLYKLKVNEDVLRKRNINAKPTEYMKRLLKEDKEVEGKATNYSNSKVVDTISNPTTDFFQSDFANEKKDSSGLKTVEGSPKAKPSTLSTLKLYIYKRKFNTDNFVAGVSNTILVNRYQAYSGNGPIYLNNGSALSWSLGMGTSDLFEDYKISGGIRFGTNSFKDKDVFISFQNNRKRLDWGVTYYRSTISNYLDLGGYVNTLYSNLYQFNVAYPFNEVKTIRAIFGYKDDKVVVKSEDGPSLLSGIGKQRFLLSHLEYVHDNTINPAQNIWNGLRWKVYQDIDMPADITIIKKQKYTYNFGFDFRNYVKIYRNFIWASRAAGDFSWGTQKIIYYLGGVDGWLNPTFNNYNIPAQDQTYAFQSLAINMRGYQQNIANGNNAVVLNSEFRLPFFSTCFNTPINNAFVRNFQFVQFFDLGTAWNGKYGKIERPTQTYGSPDGNNPIQIKIKTGGIGPLAGGYGLGCRSTLLGYFLKFDVAWPMKGFFQGSPMTYLALGVDF